MADDRLPKEAWPAWMARAQAGDGEAYTRLLHALVPVIRNIVSKQISGADLVEDTIQDVLLTLHRIRHTYDPACPFLPWLMAIANARAVDALRSRGRRWRREVSDDDTALEAAHIAAPLPYGQQEAHEELMLHLSRLPERQRQIVEHVHLQEMTLAEAARENNLTVSAVKSLLHRALGALRRSGANNDPS